MLYAFYIAFCIGFGFPPQSPLAPVGFRPPGRGYAILPLNQMRGMPLRYRD